MNINEINKLLGTSYITVEAFERYATGKGDIKNKRINGCFLWRFANKIDWDYVSSRYILNEDLIRGSHDKVDGFEIVLHQKLSEKFIEEFIDKFSGRLDLAFVVLYQNVSMELVERYRNKINWRIVTPSGGRYRQEIFDKYIDYI